MIHQEHSPCIPFENKIGPNCPRNLARAYLYISNLIILTSEIYIQKALAPKTNREDVFYNTPTNRASNRASESV